MHTNGINVDTFINSWINKIIFFLKIVPDMLDTFEIIFFGTRLKLAQLRFNGLNNAQFSFSSYVKTWGKGSISIISSRFSRLKAVL